MMRALGVSLKTWLVVCTLFTCGLGSTSIQLIAWATMIPTQVVNTESVTQAVENTFSGDYPCPLCRAAAEQRHQELLEAQKEQDKPAPKPQKESLKKLPLPFPQSSDPFVVARQKTIFPKPQSDSKLHSILLDIDCPPPDFG